MYSHGMISTVWPDDSICKSGLDAMIVAWNCSRAGKNLQRNRLMREIVEYNTVDCKAVQEIVEYFRTNH